MGKNFRDNDSGSGARRPFRGGGRPSSNIRSNVNSAMKKPSMPMTNNEITTDGNYSDEGFQETQG